MQENDDDIIKGLSTLTVYGMSFGISRPVEVLKMKINLSRKDLTHERKYLAECGVAPEVLIDSYICAVVERLTKA